MQNVSPEQMANLVAGATPVQIVILILLGAAVLAATLIIVLNLIKIYTAPLQKELDDARRDGEILRKIQIDIEKISAALWSKEDIQEKIQGAIDKHVIDYHTKTIKTQ
jgi:hypothetical protein